MTTPQDLPNPSEAHIIQFRIERGANAVGTDGVFGTVQQIVVDHESGQLRALIIRSDQDLREYELPASHIRHAHGQQVELDLSRAELAQHPEYLTPYDPSHYVPLYEGVRLPTTAASEESMTADRPVVTRIEGDAAELVTADPNIAPDGEEDTVILHQPGGQTAPVYNNPTANQRAVASAEGLPSNLGQPTATPATASTEGRANPADLSAGSAGVPPIGQMTPATPKVSVTGTGPDDVSVAQTSSRPATATPNKASTASAATNMPASTTLPTPVSAQPGGDLIAREAPPTPTDHQLPAQTSGAASATSGTPAATLLRSRDQTTELPKPSPTEFAGPQQQLPPASSGSATPVPWGLLLPLAGLAGAGIVTLTIRRARRNARRDMKKRGRNLQRTLQQQMKQAKESALQARAQVRQNVRGAQQQTPRARDLARQAQGNLADALGSLGQSRDTILDTMTHLPERARWFARGAVVGGAVGGKVAQMSTLRGRARWFARGARMGNKAAPVTTMPQRLRMLRQGARMGNTVAAVTSAPSRARWFARGAALGTKAATSTSPAQANPRAIRIPTAPGTGAPTRATVLWVIPMRRGATLPDATTQP